MAKRKKQYADDDGRVIASMNVEGMPWYVDKRVKSPGEQDFSDLSKEESRALVFGAMKAGLLIGGIFLLAAFVFILFCLYVWFR